MNFIESILVGLVGVAIIGAFGFGAIFAVYYACETAEHLYNHLMK